MGHKRYQDKGSTITSIIKDLREADIFLAATCKENDDGSNRFASIRWTPKGEQEDTLIKFLTYLFHEPYITEEIVLKALCNVRLVESDNPYEGDEDDLEEL